MDVNSAKVVLQLTETGFDVSFLMVHVLHALQRELEPVRVREKDFSLFLARKENKKLGLQMSYTINYYIHNTAYVFQHKNEYCYCRTTQKRDMISICSI